MDTIYKFTLAALVLVCINPASARDSSCAAQAALYIRDAAAKTLSAKERKVTKVLIEDAVLVDPSLREVALPQGQEEWQAEAKFETKQKTKYYSCFEVKILSQGCQKLSVALIPCED